MGLVSQSARRDDERLREAAPDRNDMVAQWRRHIRTFGP
jgi:hypothetical protein